MAKGTTPIGLAGLCLLGGIVSATLGTTALAGWLDSIQDNDSLRDLAPKVLAFGARTGLDRPYTQLHQLVRAAEAGKFFGPR